MSPTGHTPAAAALAAIHLEGQAKLLPAGAGETAPVWWTKNYRTPTITRCTG
jgi:hypothetical protein